MGTITAKLYDLQSNLLADISPIALEKSLKRLHAGPRTFTIESIAGHPLLKTVPMGGDGYPNLWSGNRKLVVWEAGITDPIFHGRVFNAERVGTGGRNVPITITAFSSDMGLGFEADERAGRPVRDHTGNFINPTFVSSVDGGAAISGPDLIKQALTYSQGPDPESGAHPGEGPLEIDLVSGTFDLAVPPAVDLSCVDSMDWPVLCGDFVQQLVQTGVCDYNLRPLAPGTGKNLAGVLDPFVMEELSARSRIGTDRSATVHFDYDTGARNASGIRHLQDFSKICNKLYDYLGPRKTKTRWAGNITPGSPGTTVDPTASRVLYGSQFMWIRIYDSVGTENSSRPLYLALWNAEQGFRVFPRDLLYITPSKGDKALYDALKDYDAGDDVAVNAGGSLGLDLTATQRLYGFTKTWSRENVSQVSELLTSAENTYG